MKCPGGSDSRGLAPDVGGNTSTRITRYKNDPHHSTGHTSRTGPQQECLLWMLGANKRKKNVVFVLIIFIDVNHFNHIIECFYVR